MNDRRTSSSVCKSSSTALRIKQRRKKTKEQKDLRKNSSRSNPTRSSSEIPRGSANTRILVHPKVMCFLVFYSTQNIPPLHDGPIGPFIVHTGMGL